MKNPVVLTSEIRSALGQITRRFDDGDTEPVFFGSHRRPQAVLVPIITWEKLVAKAEDELDFDLARNRLEDKQSWLEGDELDTALDQASKRSSAK